MTLAEMRALLATYPSGSTVPVDWLLSALPAAEPVATGPGVFTPLSAAAFLSCSPETIRRAIRRGDLPAQRTGRSSEPRRQRLRITRADLERWAAHARVERPSRPAAERSPAADPLGAWRRTRRPRSLP